MGRTLVEGFAYPQYCSGFVKIMYGLEESLKTIALDKLVDYVLKWGMAVSKRIGWALQTLHWLRACDMAIDFSILLKS